MTGLFILLFLIIVSIVMALKNKGEAIENAASFEKRKQERKLFDKLVVNSAMELEFTQMAEASIQNHTKLPEVESICAELNIPYPFQKSDMVRLLLGSKGYVCNLDTCFYMEYGFKDKSNHYSLWDTHLSYVEVCRMERKVFLWILSNLRKRGIQNKLYGYGFFAQVGTTEEHEAYIDIEYPNALVNRYKWDVYIGDQIPVLHMIDPRSAYYFDVEKNKTIFD